MKDLIRRIFSRSRVPVASINTIRHLIFKQQLIEKGKYLDEICYD